MYIARLEKIGFDWETKNKDREITFKKFLWKSLLDLWIDFQSRGK